VVPALGAKKMMSAARQLLLFLKMSLLVLAKRNQRLSFDFWGCQKKRRQAERDPQTAGEEEEEEEEEEEAEDAYTHTHPTYTARAV
jgi:hypothetical protein